MRFFYILVTGLVLQACGSSANEQQRKPELKQDTVVSTKEQSETTPIRRYAEGMEDFTNMEWIEYCLPMPVYEYPETFEGTEKGEHTFAKKGDKNSYIVVGCLAMEDTSISLKNYVKNYYPVNEELEEQGKIITRRELKENTRCFYVQGYYSNKIYESRFLEMTWLRKGEVVKLEAHYPVADTAKWTDWIVSWLTVDSQCR